MSTKKRKPSPVPSTLITAKEAARRLSIGVRTLWRLVADGRFPRPIRFTRKLVRWYAPDLDAYLLNLVRPDAAGGADHAA